MAGSDMHPAAPSEQRIRVLVADDHPAVIRGIERLITDQPDMVLVGGARDALTALRLLACDVAVVDYHLGQHSGLWLTVRLKQSPAPPAVLLYSAFSDDVLTVAGVVAGADGVLRKSAVATELCDAVRRLARGQRYLSKVPPSVLRALTARIDPADRAAFALLADGWSVPIVAERLGFGVDRVERARQATLQLLAPSASRARGPIGPVRALRVTPVTR